MNAIQSSVRVLNIGLKSKNPLKRDDKLNRQAQGDNKTYSSEMLQIDIKELAVLKNETKQQTREYSLVGIVMIILVFLHKQGAFLKLLNKIGAVFICLDKMSV